MLAFTFPYWAQSLFRVLGGLAAVLLACRHHCVPVFVQGGVVHAEPPRADGNWSVRFVAVDC